MGGRGAGAGQRSNPHHSNARSLTQGGTRELQGCALLSSHMWLQRWLAHWSTPSQGVLSIPTIHGLVLAILPYPHSQLSPGTGLWPFSVLVIFESLLAWRSKSFLDGAMLTDTSLPGSAVATFEWRTVSPLILIYSGESLHTAELLMPRVSAQRDDSSTLEGTLYCPLWVGGQVRTLLSPEPGSLSSPQTQLLSCLQAQAPSLQDLGFTL